MEAVFWDYDNTILSTADAHWKKHHTVLAKQGISLDEAFRKRIYENNGSQNWEWISRELGLKVPEKEYLQAIDLEFQKEMLTLEMRSGVLELFSWIKQLGIPQAIITNARKNSAQPVLEKREISPFMQFIFYKEDYEGRKPDPSPYLQGFNKMSQILGRRIEPKKCLIIEDDPKGVESGHKAGAVVIHRKLAENEESSPFADFACYHKNDFIKIVKDLLFKT